MAPTFTFPSAPLLEPSGATDPQLDPLKVDETTAPESSVPRATQADVAAQDTRLVKSTPAIDFTAAHDVPL